MIPKEMIEAAAKDLIEAGATAPDGPYNITEGDARYFAKSALTAALSAQWKGMESAPKDGTSIMVAMPPHETGEGWEFHVVFYDDKSVNGPKFCWHEYGGCCWNRDMVSHWTHLPPPPAQE